jgi:hypothetical protein
LADQQPTITTVVAPTFWTGQLLHFTALTLLLLASWMGWQAAGSPAPISFWVAIAVPIAHQIFVWITWRRVLQKSPSDEKEEKFSFALYLAIFFALLVSRPISLLVLSWVDRGSLQLPGMPRIVLTLLLIAPAVYAFYSVMRYFGLARAAGADHFDLRYRGMPLVKRGIFRFTSNGMYLYAFFLFWAIAIGFDSTAAILVAAFSHAYIWVHFYATEKPDMAYLYPKPFS